MLAFLLENLATIIVLILVAAAVIFAIFTMIKNKKNGKTSCGCGCSGCPNSALCHQKKK